MSFVTDWETELDAVRQESQPRGIARKQVQSSFEELEVMLAVPWPNPLSESAYETAWRHRPAEELAAYRQTAPKRSLGVSSARKRRHSCSFDFYFDAAGYDGGISPDSWFDASDKVNSREFALDNWFQSIHQFRIGEPSREILFTYFFFGAPAATI